MLPIISQHNLLTLYQKQKLSTYKIASKFKCHAAEIRKLLQQYGIKIRSKKEASLLDRGIIINKNSLKKLYLQNGLSSSQIANIFCCDPSTIAKKLHEFNIPIKPPTEKIKITKVELERLYFKQKLSCNQIVKHLNCDIKTLRKRIRKYGIVLRPNKKVAINKQKLIDHYYKEKLSLKEIGNLYNIVPAAVLRKMRKFNISLRSCWEGNIIYPKKPFNGSLEEKAYLIGFRLGDLGVRQKSDRSSIQIGCNSTKIEQANLIKQIFNKYSHVWIGKPNHKGVMSISALLHPTFSFLLPKQDCINAWITSNVKYTLAFIAGYTDAEGNIGIYDGRAKFRIGSYDIGILKQIHNAFEELDIKSILRLEQVKGFKDKRGVIHNGDFWRICINEKNSLIKIFNLLLPYMQHQKRIKNLLEARDNIYQRNHAIIHA